MANSDKPETIETRNSVPACVNCVRRKPRKRRLREKPRGPPARGLAIEGAQPKVLANEARGCDPYNTSGSFDRKKNWTRVGKR